jgi:hypothetical protein
VRATAAVLACAALAAACGGGSAPLKAPDGGSVAVSPDVALAFQRRVDGFYGRLAHRRFNSIETFDDFILRGYFRSPDLFFDYYADLAQSLAEAHFEKSRPAQASVLDFLFEDEHHAQVQARFEGWDDRPLRPGRTRLVRVDRWEYAEGEWWITPGKL